MKTATVSHTPGPWFVQPIEGKAAQNVRAGQQSVAMVYTHIGSPALMDQDGQGEANARLIAAAPDLLAAARNAANVLAALAMGDLKSVSRDSAALAQLRAALARVNA